MKTKVQKQEELKKGKDLLGKAQILVYTDFSSVSAENLRKFRKELTQLGSKLLVMKKRLLGVLLKEKGIDFDPKQQKGAIGAVFSERKVDEVAGAVFKFFKEIGAEKEKILGGYDMSAKQALDQKTVLMIGQLPPREILLAQLLGMIAAPIRSFLYVLDQKSKQTVETK